MYILRRVDVELAIAGLGWLLLAAGHTAVGHWVLPALREIRLPSTPFGPSSMTMGMLRFTWHIVSVVLLAFGVLLTTLALAPDADPRTLLLRWFVAFVLFATAMVVWQGRRRPSSLVRLPIPLVFVVIAVMCWTASAG